jgi:hypothetical protein
MKRYTDVNLQEVDEMVALVCVAGAMAGFALGYICAAVLFVARQSEG